MTFKKTLPVITLMLALLFVVSTAIAQSPESGDKKDPAASSRMSAEQQAAWAELWKDHRDKIEPLRDQIWAKQLEYDFLVTNPNTKPGEMKAVIEEMQSLKSKLRAEKNKLAEAARAKDLDVHKFGPGGPMRDWGGHGYDGDCRCSGSSYGHGPARHPGKGYDRYHGGQMMGND